MASNDYISWTHVLPSVAGTSSAGLDDGDLFLFKDYNIGDEVIPVDVEDSGEAALMESFEES